MLKADRVLQKDLLYHNVKMLLRRWRAEFKDDIDHAWYYSLTQLLGPDGDRVHLAGQVKHLKDVGSPRSDSEEASREPPTPEPVCGARTLTQLIKRDQTRLWQQEDVRIQETHALNETMTLPACHQVHEDCINLFN